MNILNKVSEAIKRHGSKIYVKCGLNTEKSFGFISPLRYKNNMYLSGRRLPSGYFDGGHYLLIALPEIELSDYVNTVIYCGTKGYIIKRAEKYIYKNKVVYVWAIVTPYSDSLEDDYDDN